MAHKSAKDIAFERERIKFRKEIHRLNSAIQEKDVKHKEVLEQLHCVENDNEKLRDWIARLLEYTKISEEDLAQIIDAEKHKAKVMSDVENVMRFLFPMGVY